MFQKQEELLEIIRKIATLATYFSFPIGCCQNDLLYDLFHALKHVILFLLYKIALVYDQNSYKSLRAAIVRNDSFSRATETAVALKGNQQICNKVGICLASGSGHLLQRHFLITF